MGGTDGFAGGTTAIGSAILAVFRARSGAVVSVELKEVA